MGKGVNSNGFWVIGEEGGLTINNQPKVGLKMQICECSEDAITTGFISQDWVVVSPLL